MDLEKVKITLAWFRFGTAMVVWRNKININSKFTKAYFWIIIQAIIHKHKYWPQRFQYQGSWYMIDLEKIRSVCEELWHLKQQSRFKYLIQYWWYSRGSVFYYPRAPNEKEAKAWAQDVKKWSPIEVNEELTSSK